MSYQFSSLRKLLLKEKGFSQGGQDIGGVLPNAGASRSVNATAAASWNLGPLGSGATVSWIAEERPEITDPTWEEVSDPV